MVPEHEDHGLGDPAYPVDHDANYIIKISKEGQNQNFTYFLPTLMSPWYRSDVFNLEKNSSAGAMS